MSVGQSLPLTLYPCMGTQGLELGLKLGLGFLCSQCARTLNLTCVCVSSGSLMDLHVV